jgi:DNA-binding HxlR family transcriptional regulator
VIERHRYSAENCMIAATLAVVGEKWTLLVIREAFYGVRRFAEFQRHLGCPRNVLSERLAKLVEHGLLETREYREPGQRARHEYRLTEKGRELFPALIALMTWGDRWEVGPEGRPVEVLHRDCGGHVGIDVVCDRGHGGLTARDTQPVPGPGARELPAA